MAMHLLTTVTSTKATVAIPLLFMFVGVLGRSQVRTYNEDDLKRLRDEVSAMFHHAYQGYLDHAHPYDELRPLSCDGVDTWGSYSLTLIDALDTLAVMGNYSEFRRVYHVIGERKHFDNDINVSVFETNIRILGGLLSGHLLAHKAGIQTEPGWPCEGPLLRLAEDVANRLLPAFDTPTGMPYGTVNLRHGVPEGETPVTCTAGVGTFIVEFGALSRLTGNPIYEETALRALRSLWHHRSKIGLVGNHIDVVTGKWTATDAGIGAGVDSYYEYLVKASILLQRPELMHMFKISQESIEQYLKHDDWHFWVTMNQGVVSMPVFQSLEAFYPGILALIGENIKGMKTMHNYHSVWKQFGFLPEFFNVAQNGVWGKREGYPLRPELVESAMYLYRTTKDPFLLKLGEDVVNSIQFSTRTDCGYATVKDVHDHTLEDRMESFFLAETTKYLYLLFDDNNFIHNDGSTAELISTSHGDCVIDAGGYIFNTEAHPIDPASLKCCSAHTKQELQKHISEHMLDIMDPRNFREFRGDLIPERVEQIRRQQEEQELKRRQKRAEYLRKMEEHLAKEREAIRRNKALKHVMEKRYDTVSQSNFSQAPEGQMDSIIVSTDPETQDNAAAVSLPNPEEELQDTEPGTDESRQDSKDATVDSEVVNAGTRDDEDVLAPETASVHDEHAVDLSTDADEADIGQGMVEEIAPSRAPSRSADNGPKFSTEKQSNRIVGLDGKAINEEASWMMIKRQSKDEAVQEVDLKPAVNSNRRRKISESVVDTLHDILGKFSKFLPTRPRHFDHDFFVQKVMNSDSEYPLDTRWYDDHTVMSCPARTFLERFSLQGEFFEKY